MQFNKGLIADVLGSWRHIPSPKKHYLGYSRIVENCEYAIYERPLKADKIVAACGDSIVKLHGKTTLILIPNARVPMIRYVVKLNSETFPGLFPNSTIVQCLLLPYLREVKKDSYLRELRLCVFTDQGQIFHNKPARDTAVEGKSLPNDIICFEESVVWDLPGRKRPSLNPMPDFWECYYPGLPESCYTCSPMSNEDPGFTDRYGNGGFGETQKIRVDGEEKICARFYNYSREVQANPYLFIGSGQRNDKVFLIGTYRANVVRGVRICLFATSNGGREWFCKYEFSDAGEYAFQQGYSEAWGTNFGNKIMSHVNEDCTNKNLCVQKRTIQLPTVANGDINTSFCWEKMSMVSEISGLDGTIVKTQNAHGLITGNIVALQSENELSVELDWLRCSAVTSTGSVGGQQFKVRVIDNRTFEILELVSSQVPTLPCRHIHHINPMKDGWIIGTGEIYPNGWLLYMEQKKADTYSRVGAEEAMEIARMNTSPQSVQRTMGVLLRDTQQCDVIIASDHDTLERNALNGTSLQRVSRGSTGVFVGKLEDVDDRNRFECVFEATEPCYYFQKLDGVLVYAGQRGELGICFDPAFKKWNREHVGRFIMYYMGNYYNAYCFNDYVIIRK